MKTLVNLLVYLSLSLLASCQETQQVRVHVTEEDQSAVEGAAVDVRYLGYGSRKEETKSGKTDVKGNFESSGHADLAVVIFISKDGYYPTQSEDLNKKQDHDLTFVLRKIKNPIPLYARRFRKKVPSIGNEHGFDFQVGDWVEPEGRGKITDLLFLVKIVNDENGKLAGKLNINFSKSDEGMIVVIEKNGYIPTSKLHLPNQAPVAGYSDSFERIESSYENKSKPMTTSYFFRTRGTRIKLDKMVYCYSKLADGVKFTMGGGKFLDEPYRSKYPDEYGMVEFTYYFNPTSNDRNLEFDLRRNLFKKLTAEEMVHEP